MSRSDDVGENRDLSESLSLGRFSDNEEDGNLSKDADDLDEEIA